MRVLYHHIYEYKKGLRDLVLHTLDSKYRRQAEERLLKDNISYIIREISAKKINIFFGADECVAIIAGFGNKSLNEFSDEEDFILGIMLGYCRMKQCQRYLERKHNYEYGFIGREKKRTA